MAHEKNFICDHQTADVMVKHDTGVIPQMLKYIYS